jgi:hypothetical protein
MCGPTGILVLEKGYKNVWGRVVRLTTKQSPPLSSTINPQPNYARSYLMRTMSSEEAKAYVNKYMDDLKAQGWEPGLIDVNVCISTLRSHNFHVTIDGTRKVIGDVMMDGRGNPNFSVVGEVRGR